MHDEERNEQKRDHHPEARFPDPSLEEELAEILAEHLRAVRASEASQPRRRRAQALRLPSRMRPALAGVLILIFAGAAAAAVTLTLQHSAPLSGRVPPSARAARWGLGFTEAGRRYRIVFAPLLSAGNAGWISDLYLGRGERQGGSGEGGYPSTATPMLLGASDYKTTGARGGKIVHYALTGPAVAAVEVGARTIQTRRGAALPARDRIAVFALPADSAQRRYSRRSSLPARLRLASPHAARPLHIVPLDRHGVPVQATGASENAPRLPIRTWRHEPGAAAEGAGSSASHLQGGVCALASRGLPALMAVRAEVVLRLRPVENAVGELLLSCLQATYTLHGSQLHAAILLDARRPAQGQPGPIPGASPVRGHPGTVNSVLGRAVGDITAHRYGKAWLVVAGGSGLPQRLEVLAALRIARPATGSLQRP